MRKIILTYGAITGYVIILSMTLGIYAASRSRFILCFRSIGLYHNAYRIFDDICSYKKYRDDELGGVINFGTAFKVGLGISLIAGVVYVITWEINLLLTDYAFIDEYTATIIENARNNGATEEQIQQTIQEMEVMKERYGKVLFRLPMTFTEIFPVGLLVSLISAFLFKNPRFLANPNLKTTEA